jgi:hypothetical protein
MNMFCVFKMHQKYTFETHHLAMSLIRNVFYEFNSVHDDKQRFLRKRKTIFVLFSFSADGDDGHKERQRTHQTAGKM